MRRNDDDGEGRGRGRGRGRGGRGRGEGGGRGRMEGGMGGGRGGKREYERKSGDARTGVKAEDKRGGGGKGNWGTFEDDPKVNIFDAFISMMIKIGTTEIHDSILHQQILTNHFDIKIVSMSRFIFLIQEGDETANNTSVEEAPVDGEAPAEGEAKEDAPAEDKVILLMYNLVPSY